MTRDEELIQKFQTKTDVILEKAEQYLTTVLPGGPGVFAYVVLSNLVGKLYGNTREYVENAINKPVTLPDFVYYEPLDEELMEFFDDERLKSIRSEFPEKYEDFSDDDWAQLRRNYMPLYLALTAKEPFMSELFASEIQTKNYKRIVDDFALLPLYKKTLESIPSASRKNALWKAVSSVLGDTVKEIWSKDYAMQVFGEAKARPEVAGLIENIKEKIRERVDLDQLSGIKDTIKELTGY